MRNILSLFATALLSSTAMLAHTYDQVQVVPSTATAGQAATLSIRLDNPSAKDAVKYLQFTVAYPEGWTVSGPSLIQERMNDYDPDFEEYATEAKMTITATKEANNVKYIINAKTFADVIAGETGSIFTVKVKVPTGTPDGFYPINILSENSYYAVDTDATHNTILGASTSYVKVGNPTGKALALQGTIPSFVNEALAGEVGISSLDLTAVTTSNGVFTYRPGRDVKAPTADVTTLCKFVADAPAEPHQFASISVPFDATVSCYTLGETKNGWINLVASSSLHAGASAIINQAVESQVTTDKLRNVQAQAVETGAYLKNDTFYQVNGNATIPALRGHWNLDASIKGFVLPTDEDGISNVNADNNDEPVYNVAGQRQAKAQRGVNITESKKFIKQ